MPPSKKSVFFFRVLSTVGLWTLTLATILKGWETGFFLLIGVIGMTALWEYFGMLEQSGRHTFRIFGMVCGLVLFTGCFYFSRKDGPTRSYDFEILVLLAFMLGVFARQMFEKTRDPAPLDTMAFTIFGLLYAAWLFSFVTKIVYIVPRNGDGSVAGQFYVLYLIAVTKFSDMGAYITGSLIGKHPLVPHISPAKTWEGFFGALAFSLLASFGLWWLLPGQLNALNATHCWVLGLVLGFAAIVGDLGESLIKRSTGVKDSGKFLPGIGGALDLVDSLLFTAPLLYFYLRFIVLPSP
ncbi:MAG TPA: phosphatidate cytidylyltransferase [Chthoniobacterales bacterium]